jgi:trk system potassium uptake protein TrkA
MQILVIGCGKVGSKLANVLSREGHDVVVIENETDNFKELDRDFKGVTICGVPIDQDVLRSAGIETADAVAAVTPDDNVNIMVSQIAKEIFKVPKVIARIYNPAREHVFHEFGLETVCPTNMTVSSIHSKILLKPLSEEEEEI